MDEFDRAGRVRVGVAALPGISSHSHISSGPGASV